LLCSIPGIAKVSAMLVLSELGGGDLKDFDSPARLVGWVGMKPRNEETAGKIKSRKTLHGNNYLRVTLVEIAWAAVATKNSFFRKKYLALRKRNMAEQKALFAIARKIVVAIYIVLKNKQMFDRSMNMPDH